MPFGLNDTYICLIPKVRSPQKITEYCPISLCNVVYKIVAKVLANRLKGVLSEVISDAQSAFVPGRQITDNVIAAFEVMHCINQRRKGKEGLVAIKLDMSKAYDRVEWGFLEAMMRKMGFQDRWISLMMMCVNTVSYSVLINGEPKGRIVPSRGLKQGDPISPYLFLLCVEGLSAMLQRDEFDTNLRGISVCRGAPRISHLLFADDCIVFCKASVDEGLKITTILEKYEKESGQKLNKEKTSLFFSKNTRREVQEAVKDMFGAEIIHQHERYLGLPPLVGRGKKKAFNRIKDQVERKIAGWKGKLLSSAGREILIKAVAQATPTYTMNCFKIPESLCSELNSLISNFWWGQREKERKLAWISWEKMCKPKADGGMGFKDLRAFNLALLAKQGWRLFKNLGSLTHRILKARYFPDRNFMEAQLGPKPSYTWRSLLAGRNVLEKGLRWSVGNGQSVRIWDDRWLPTLKSFKVVSPRLQELNGTMVESLLDLAAGGWNKNLIRDMFLPFESKAILSIPISLSFPKDSLLWAWTQNGRFTMSSGYKVAYNGLLEQRGKLEEGEASTPKKWKEFWSLSWGLNCPSKIKHFMWRVCKNTLPTNYSLKLKRIPVEDTCGVCGMVESSGHAL